jgi:23S rRNA (guanosine2251-2'-O)-methyltransferase
VTKSDRTSFSCFAKKLKGLALAFSKIAYGPITVAILSQTAYAVNSYYAFHQALLRYTRETMLRRPLALVLPDVRSAQNVGAMWRTADATGVDLVITCGYTPHPRVPDDPRAGHVVASNERALAKTALGAQATVPHRHFAHASEAFAYLHNHNYNLVALEQAEGSTDLYAFEPAGPTALVVGNEVTGLTPELLAACELTLELPMLGRKESLNVAVAAGIALYQLRFGSFIP